MSVKDRDADECIVVGQKRSRRNRVFVPGSSGGPNFNVSWECSVDHHVSSRLLGSDWFSAWILAQAA